MKCLTVFYPIRPLNLYFKCVYISCIESLEIMKNKANSVGIGISLKANPIINVSVANYFLDFISFIFLKPLVTTRFTEM